VSRFKPRLLWVSDAACPTGFATVSHNVLGWLGSKWDRVVLGVNATGDPHHYPFPIYPTRVGGDFWGFGRFASMVKRHEPDVVLIQSDGWIIASFVEIARQIPNCPPVVGWMPIDGEGMKRSTAATLSELALALFYTQFGVDQARAAGLTAPARAIGLGVRREVFCPIPKADARRYLPDDLPEGAFVWGNVNRNQPRKRLDLTIGWFAEFLKTDPVAADSFLYLHCLKEDVGWDLEELAHFYGVADRVLFSLAETPEELVDEAKMRFVYNALDVQITTTMGEGWGLPTLEGMACGVPQICPDWAALGEWPRGAVRLVEVDPGAASFGYKAFSIGSTPRKADFLAAMHELKADEELRRALSAAALERASEKRFDWKYAAACIDEDLTAVIEERRAKAA
jgi:D-inositol-3-phosphate glycosyltransferase